MGTRAARVGFHAPRVNETSFDVSPGASANVGAYLYQIGITDFTTILSLTSAVPQSTRWLSFYGDALTLQVGRQGAQHDRTSVGVGSRSAGGKA